MNDAPILHVNADDARISVCNPTNPETPEQTYTWIFQICQHLCHLVGFKGWKCTQFSHTWKIQVYIYTYIYIHIHFCVRMEQKINVGKWLAVAKNTVDRFPSCFRWMPYSSFPTWQQNIAKPFGRRAGGGGGEGLEAEFVLNLRKQEQT